MSIAWPLRTIFAFAAALVVMAMLAITSQTSAQAPQWLGGQLLIASPDMGDPRFNRTVILMVRHDKDGAFGLVINRPLREEPMSALLELLGEKDENATGSVRIHYGGPVQPELGFIVHSADYHDAGTREIDGRVAMTSSRDIIRAIGHNMGPKQHMIVFGYAGWAPGQLEGEIARRGWVSAPADLALIFDLDREKVWDVAYGRRTQDL